MSYDIGGWPRHHTQFYQNLRDFKNKILIGLSVDTPYDLAREAGYKIFYWEDMFQENMLSKLVNQRHDLGKSYENFHRKGALLIYQY